jgi:hypothetical protein
MEDPAARVVGCVIVFRTILRNYVFHPAIDQRDNLCGGEQHCHYCTRYQKEHASPSHPLLKSLSHMRPEKGGGTSVG